MMLVWQATDQLVSVASGSCGYRALRFWNERTFPFRIVTPLIVRVLVQPLGGETSYHITPATTQIYARLSDDPTRKALEDHSRRIMAVVNDHQGEVVNVKKKAGA